MNKKVLKNIINKIGFASLGQVISFITIPIVSRLLGPEKYGNYNYVIAIAGYAFILANWGFLAKGIREVAKTPQNALNIVEEITSGRISLWLIGGLFCVLVTSFVYQDITFFKYLCVAILINFGTAFSIDYYFYGIKQTFLPSLSILVGQITFLVLLLSFYKVLDSLIIILLFNLIAKLVESLILFISFKRKVKETIKLRFFDFNLGFSIIKENFLLGIGAKASFFISTIPVIFIPLFLSIRDLGEFSAAYKLFLVYTMLIQSLNLVFSPWIVDYRNKSSIEKKKLFIKLLLLFSLIGLFSSIVSFFIGDFVVNILFGNKFQKAKTIFRMLSISIVPIWPIYALLSSYMNNHEKDYAFFFGTIILLILLITLIPFGLDLFSLNGVVYAITLAILIISIYYFFRLKNLLFRE